MRPPNHEQQTRMEASGYVTVPDACSRLGMARSTVYAAIREEKILSTYVGSRKYIEVDSLLEHVGPIVAALWATGA